MSELPASIVPKDCSILTVKQVAAMLGVTDRHVSNLVEAGDMNAIDIRSRSVTRRALRIPVEFYCEYVLVSSRDIDWQRAFLRALPKSVARAFLTYLTATLETPLKTLESTRGAI